MRPKRRRVGVLLAAAALAITGAAHAVAARGGTYAELRAFQRPYQASDRLSGRIAADVSDSRRVQTLRVTSQKLYRLYAAKTRDGRLCIALAHGGGIATACSYEKAFFARDRRVALLESRVIAGIAANDVARVVVVGARGKRHVVPVSRDGGFIYNCRAYNGCPGLVAAVEAFDAGGRRVSRQTL
jgi:hypothetical protein